MPNGEVQHLFRIAMRRPQRREIHASTPLREGRLPELPGGPKVTAAILEAPVI
jgi:hypothetical protein